MGKSRFSLGTAQFGSAYGIANRSGRVEAAEARRILAEAFRNGITSLDTAIAYGESEAIMGSIGMEHWQIVSKLPELPDGITDVTAWAEGQVSASLSRLRVKKLYALLLHRPDQLLGTRGTELADAVQSLKIDGSVEKIGISIYSPEELDSLFDVMHFDIVQAPMNILDRRMEESGWVGRLTAMDVELHMRSVFLQGLLLMPGAGRPEKFNKWKNIWTEWDRWLAESGVSPLEACVRYALSVQGVDNVIVGVDSVEQLQEILAAAAGKPLLSLPAWPRQIETDLVNPSRWSQI